MMSFMTFLLALFGLFCMVYPIHWLDKEIEKDDQRSK